MERFSGIGLEFAVEIDLKIWVFLVPDEIWTLGKISSFDKTKRELTFEFIKPIFSGDENGEVETRIIPENKMKIVPDILLTQIKSLVKKSKFRSSGSLRSSISNLENIITGISYK